MSEIEHETLERHIVRQSIVPGIYSVYADCMAGLVESDFHKARGQCERATTLLDMLVTAAGVDEEDFNEEWPGTGVFAHGHNGFDGEDEIRKGFQLHVKTLTDILERLKGYSHHSEVVRSAIFLVEETRSKIDDVIACLDKRGQLEADLLALTQEVQAA